MKKALIGLVAVVVLGGAGYLVLASNANQPEPVSVEPTPEVTATPTPSARPGLQTTDLKPSRDAVGEGTATRLVINGRFEHNLSATLPDPGQGKFYAGYLARQSPPAYFYTGKLQKEGDKYILNFQQSRIPTGYDQVIVSLEAADDKKIETRVLEGIFPGLQLTRTP